MKLIFLLLTVASLRAYPVAISGDGSGGIICNTDGLFVGRASGIMGCYTPAASGGISGPGSSIAHNLSSYTDTTGILLEDSGISKTNLCLLTGNQAVAGVKTFSSLPIFSACTANTVPYLDSGKALACSSVTPTQLGYLDATSSIQTQLNAKQATLATGNITGSNGVTFSGGTGAVIGSGVTGTCATATDSISGCLSAADHAQLSTNTSNIALKAPLASPVFTGTIGTSLTASSSVITDISGNLATVAAGTTGNVMTSNGTTWTSAAASGGAPNPAATISQVDDFVGGLPGGTFAGTSGNIFGQLYWQASPVGSGANVNNQDAGFAGGHQSTVSLNTGTTTTGSLSANIPNDYLSPGDGAMTVDYYINFSALSNGTDTYLVRFGLGNNGGTSSQSSNEMSFEYDSTQSANWRFYTRNSSTQTTGVSAVAVTVAWHHLQITTNVANTSTAFFIDGVQAANSPITTNIPTGLMLPYAYIVKSAGTTARRLILDLFRLTQPLNTPR